MVKKYVGVELKRQPVLTRRYGADAWQRGLQALQASVEQRLGVACQIAPSATGWTVKIELDSAVPDVLVGMMEATLSGLASRMFADLLDDASNQAHLDDASPACAGPSAGVHARPVSHSSLIVEPVCDVDRPDVVVCYACVPQPISSLAGSSQITTSVDSVPSGWASEQERQLVERAVAALHAHEDLQLIVPLTLADAFGAAHWEAIIELLAAAPAATSRLIIELSESAPVASDVAYEQIRQLRQLGCRTSIGGFGPHYNAEVHNAIAAPDLIRVDGGWLSGVRREPIRSRRYRGMVRLAQTMARQVVSTGIDSALDLSMAKRAGVRWVQGRYVGPPRLLH
ncbi:EAL domain-containing protein [Burkholderia seminalis]|uniref:EAL domain-containing protein n=1 Tax=Burkholderia seminalis TaxID=488731 RepID=UPI001CF4BC64|nr:EAL domain-containing protein [Burkholderia seminalis]MCA7955574.1 EAL domain-containing protein [Burkholderia seminalis]